MSKKILYTGLSFLLLLTVWQLTVTLGQFNEALFPGPLAVFQALFHLLLDGALFVHIKDSLFRFIVGYISAAIVGITLGLVFGRSVFLWQLLEPSVQLLRPVSPVAWSPFIVLVFGIGDIPAIVIIFIAAFFPILLTTVKGVQSVEPHYIKLAKNMQFNRIELYLKVIIPATIPAIMGGLQIALGTGWIFLVAGEMVGAQSGLGYLIVDARNMLHLPKVFAGIIIIGLFGLLLDRTVELLQRTLRKVGRLYIP